MINARILIFTVLGVLSSTAHSLSCKPHSFDYLRYLDKQELKESYCKNAQTMSELFLRKIDDANFLIDTGIDRSGETSEAFNECSKQLEMIRKLLKKDYQTEFSGKNCAA